MAKLVIHDPDTGARICALVIPEGATHEQIVAAGAAVLARHNATKKTNGPEQAAAAKPTDRQVLCQLCREPKLESELAAHVEVEQQRLLKLELQAEAQRGRR